MEEKKSGFWKFAARFLVIIAAAFLLVWGLGEYRKYEGRRNVGKLAEALEKAQKEDYERAMADTYGGKTPQETLRLYIEAVEAGDYELASKYFILDYQQRELDSFKDATKKFIGEYLSLLGTAIKESGVYSDDKAYFSINKPIGVRMKLYPNGIWKIIEI